MKYLIAIILLILPVSLLAITGDNTRFDWASNGSIGPYVTDDTTNTCNNTAVARFDWSLYAPSVVYDTTATCSSVASSGLEPLIIWFDEE